VNSAARAADDPVTAPRPGSPRTGLS